MKAPDKPHREENGEFRPRISSTFKELAEMMVHHGLSIDAAAEHLGANVRASRRAFARPHNRAYFNRLTQEVRQNASQLAYLRVNHLAQCAPSERLRFEASKWVVGVDGIAPVKRVHGTQDIYMTFGGFELSAIDATPEQED